MERRKKRLILLAVLLPFFIFLVVLLARRKSSFAHSFHWSYLRLDCGASSNNEEEGWRNDKDFIKAGQNKLISVSNVPEEMTTLRFFPDRDKSCYKFKLFSPEMYHIRAGFLYGNYDGLLNPPTFDLQVNGNLWTTVSTSLSEEPVYYEAIYTTRRDKNMICLVKTGDGHIPFISSIEVITLPNNFYTHVDKDNKTLLKLESRVHFIRDQDSRQWLPQRHVDNYQRMWKTRYEPNYLNITSDHVNDISLDVENSPPQKVVGAGIQAQSVTDSITFMVDFSQRGQISAYLVFYFMKPDVWADISGTRRIQINVDGQKMAITDVPDNSTCQVITLYPVMVVSPVNITITPVEGSTLPPIINAMEAYVASDLKKS